MVEEEMKSQLSLYTRGKVRWQGLMHIGSTSSPSVNYINDDRLVPDDSCAIIIQRVIGPDLHTSRYYTYQIYMISTTACRLVYPQLVEDVSVKSSGSKARGQLQKEALREACNETRQIGGGILKILKTSEHNGNAKVLGPSMTRKGSSYCNEIYAMYPGNLVTEIDQGDAVFSPTMLEQKRTKSPVFGLPIDGLASSSRAGRGKLYL